MRMKPLTEAEKHVLQEKGTELPFSGRYCNLQAAGTYLCRQCGAPLYRSVDKFRSSCGWPAFDDEIENAVRRTPDADGRRTEITCAACGGHLGHVFEGEGHTPKNIRHCVNSLSLQFVPQEEMIEEPPKEETAIFGGGCFWGVEYLMRRQAGVKEVDPGYMGGAVRQPTYEQVCTGKTGHAEVVKVVFDPAETIYEQLAKLFFEIHDPEQVGGQGPDVGEQYRSVIFYTTERQKQIAEKLIGQLTEKGYRIATKVERAHTFWPAEGYHRDYYNRRGTLPYCHAYTKRF